VGKLGKKLGPKTVHFFHPVPGHHFVNEILFQIHTMHAQG
jgi:hypothetical protein